MKFTHVIYGYWRVIGKGYDEGPLYQKDFSSAFSRSVYRWFDKVVSDFAKQYGGVMKKVRDQTLAGYHWNIEVDDEGVFASFELR